MFNINEFYSRREIQEVLGGGEVIFLPNKDNIVTCACLNPDRNICSNEGEVRILVGTGDVRFRVANLLINETNRITPIRVFIRRAVRRYEYMGRFIVAEDPITTSSEINVFRDELHLKYDPVMAILMNRVSD